MFLFLVIGVRTSSFSVGGAPELRSTVGAAGWGRRWSRSAVQGSDPHLLYSSCTLSTAESKCCIC